MPIFLLPACKHLTAVVKKIPLAVPQQPVVLYIITIRILKIPDIVFLSPAYICSSSSGSNTTAASTGTVILSGAIRYFIFINVLAVRFCPFTFLAIAFLLISMGNCAYLKGIIPLFCHIWIEIIGSSIVIFQLLHNSGTFIQDHIIITCFIIWCFPGCLSFSAAPLSFLRCFISAFYPFDTKNHFQIASTFT